MIVSSGADPLGCKNMHKSRKERKQSINGSPYANIWTNKSQNQSVLVLAMCPGNMPAVLVLTGKPGRFGLAPVQQPDPLLLGGPHQDPYQSSYRFHRVWPDLSGPISGSAFQVVLLLVIFRYPTVDCNILNDGTSLFILDVLAALIIRQWWDTLPAKSPKWASTEHQQFWVLHLG